MLCARVDGQHFAESQLEPLSSISGEAPPSKDQPIVHLSNGNLSLTFLSDVGTPASTNQWRSLTLALIRHTPDPAFKEQTAASISALADYLNKTLTNLTGIHSSDSRDKTLLSILEEAVELSRLFRAQRAEFRIESPQCAAAAARDDDSDEDDDGEEFDGGSMEDINGEDEAELLGRRVGCVTFPAVYKAGDENGDNVSGCLISGLGLSFPFASITIYQVMADLTPFIL